MPQGVGIHRPSGGLVLMDDEKAVSMYLRYALHCSVFKR